MAGEEQDPAPACGEVGDAGRWRPNLGALLRKRGWEGGEMGRSCGVTREGRRSDSLGRKM